MLAQEGGGEREKETRKRMRFESKSLNVRNCKPELMRVRVEPLPGGIVFANEVPLPGTNPEKKIKNKNKKCRRHKSLLPFPCADLFAHNLQSVDTNMHVSQQKNLSENPWIHIWNPLLPFLQSSFLFLFSLK